MEETDVPESIRRWYAIRTRLRTEKVVRENLRRQGIETFLPVMAKVRQWKHRQKRIEWALFPGWCFARCTVLERPRVLYSSGVVDLVGTGSQRDAAILDEEIAAL